MDMDGTRDCEDLCPRDGAVITACPVKRLAVQDTFVDAPLVDFPVLVRLVDNSLAISRADGADVFFSLDQDGQTPLDTQVETWDRATGTLLAWVRLPQVHDAQPTVFYLRFGDGRANGHRNPTGVWDASFRAVYHMDYGGGPGTQLDSTSNANHAAPDPTVSANLCNPSPGNQPAGVVGQALTFGGATCDRLVAPDHASLDITTQLTITAWVRPTTNGVPTSEVVVSKRIRTLEQANYQVGLSSTHNMYFMWGTTAGVYPSIASTPAATPASQAWSLVTWTVQGSPLTLRTYVNGVRVNAMDQPTSNSGVPTGSQLALVANNHPLFVGGMDQENDEVFYGDLDEVRIAATSRTPAWLRAEYENQRPGSTFLTVANP